MDDTAPISDKIKRVTEIIRKRKNIVIRSVNLKNLKEEIELVKIIYNDAWSRNWGFVPWTDAEIEHLGHEMKPVAIEDLVLFAFVDGKPAGFSLTLPDMNQALIKINGRLFPFGLLKLLWYSRKVNQLRVLAMGVCRQYQNLGIQRLLPPRSGPSGKRISSSSMYPISSPFSLRIVLHNTGHPYLQILFAFSSRSRVKWIDKPC